MVKLYVLFLSLVNTWQIDFEWKVSKTGNDIHMYFDYTMNGDKIQLLA
jgi:hypothetical protein